MDFMEILKKRRSVRDFSDKAIEKGVLEQIVDAARFAPTARGVEPWEFIVIADPVKLRKIADLADNGKFIAHAKACITVFCNETKYYLEDGCAATENLLLAATSLGVSSCWVAGDRKPYAADIAALLNLPSSYKLISMVALGYPKYENDSFKMINKRPLKEVLHWESF